MCGDAGNPSIIIFVRDFRGLDLHYNTALLHTIAQQDVNAHLIASHGHHFFTYKNTTRNHGLASGKPITKNEKQK